MNAPKLQNGATVRVLEIHDDDSSPCVEVGDVVLLKHDAYEYEGDFVHVHTDGGLTYARIELVEVTPYEPEEPVVLAGDETAVPSVATCAALEGAGPCECGRHPAPIMTGSRPPVTHNTVNVYVTPNDELPGSIGEALARAVEAHGDNTLTSKDTNPKDAVAVANLKFSALPLRVLVGPALALSEGGWKYGRHNYRVAGVKASVYFDAALDHLFAWFEGEDIDRASGVHHLDKLLAGIMVLRDAQLGGKCDDDRPPAVRAGWIEDGHAKTRELFDRMRAAYPTPRAPFTRGQGNDAT